MSAEGANAQYINSPNAKEMTVFRIDRDMRIPTFNALFGAPESLESYPVVEIVLNVPVWLLYVLSGGGDQGGEDDAPPRWKRYLVHHLRDALELAALVQWSASKLYVLLPDHKSEDGEMRLERCLEIHECEDKGDATLCWRIKTVSRTVVDSAVGTTMDQTTVGTLIWHDER